MTSRPDVFLSYSREDQATARRYAEALQREGFSVWWDQALSTGENYDAVTEQALDSARSVVVLWSPNSVSSRWVRAEATTADRNGVLMPVMIGACRRPVMFELMQTAELEQWNGDTNDPAWRAFVADLKRLVLRGQPPEAAVLLERSAQQGKAAQPVPFRGAAMKPAHGTRRTPWPKIAAAAAVLGILVAGFLNWQRTARVEQARAAVPEIAKLVDAGDYSTAFARAQEVRQFVPDDPLLKSLTPLFSTAYSIATSPPGAEVVVRDYDRVDDEWRKLGATPLSGVNLPRRALRWRIEKAGYETVEMATPPLANIVGVGRAGPLADISGQYEFELKAVGEQPPDMVFVPGGVSPRHRHLSSVAVPSFYMDRHEASNAEYKEFVDAGGYERRSWWEGLDIRKDGKSLPFEDAMRLFVDATGRPGPATWELGSYPDGKGEHPVSGISRYEAAAYARFRGKSLPTVYHWVRAALPDNELNVSLAASITPLSNFGTTGIQSRGQSQAMGPYGTYDMFGNVREWLLNSRPNVGLVIGGSWQDAAYSYGDLADVDPVERSALNGVRLMKEIGPAPNDAVLRAAIVPLPGVRTDFSAARPVADPVYETFLRQFAYRPGPLNASEPVTMATTPDWIKQKVTLDAGYNGERFDVILFIPNRATPPFQPVVLFSGIYTVMLPATAGDIEPGFAGMPLDYVVKSGRVLVQPVFQGTYERFKSPADFADELRTTREWIERRWDLGRTIDYLETRSDIDSTRTGYVGISFGASYALPLVATEPRLKAAVFLSGGYGTAPLPPIVDPVHYVPRIRIPVLMVNGRLDHIIAFDTHQRPLYQQLGTSPADKRYVLLDSGHGSLPRAEVLRETLGWFDRYLGPVN